MDRIERKIADLLTPSLASHGFNLMKDWGFFVRKQAYGHDALKVVNQGTASREYFQINMYSDIRHDIIEVPWNSLGFVHGEDSRQQTWTISLHRPRNLPPFKVRPASLEADSAEVAKQIEDTFLQTSLPFYRAFSNLRAVEALANTHPLIDLTPYNVGGPLEHRAMRSLLLAKAVNPERYASVRHAFVTSTKKTMLQREKCMEMLEQVDHMTLAKI